MKCHKRLMLGARQALIWLLLWIGAIDACGQSPDRVSYANGIQLDSIHTSSQVFSNVLIYSRDPLNVYFEHASGLGCAKVAELDPLTLGRLGFAVEPASPSAGPSMWGGLHPSLWLPAARDLSPLGLASLAVILILIVGLYLYSSFLFWLICVKVGAEPGISVWLPVVQILPLLRAAKMSVLGPVSLLLLLVASILLRPHFGSYAWTLALISGMAGLACFLTWSVKICCVRNKSPLLAGLLVVPGVNFFALLYLAGSK
jgi:hypothetical protein